MRETLYGLQINARAFRYDHQIITTDTYDLVDTTLSIKWQGHGHETYAQFGLGIPELLFSTGSYGGFSTHHSWSGSTVISDDTWYHTAITINADQTYEIISSTGDYVYNGGSIIKTTTGIIDNSVWSMSSNAKIVAWIGDPSAGTNAYMGIAEVDISSNTPVPEPSTIFLLGVGLAGLGIFRNKFRK